jgi:hypothetical protein
MMQTMRSFAITLGVVLVVLTMTWSPSHAQTAFSNASLQGTYSLYNTAGDIGSWGLVTFDGDNEWTLASTGNLPDGMGGRINVSFSTFPGTYVVNPDGTGVATIQFVGALSAVNYDFVISEVQESSDDGPPCGRAGGHDHDDDHALATEVSAVLREGGVAGQLVAPVFKRISD